MRSDVIHRRHVGDHAAVDHGLRERAQRHDAGILIAERGVVVVGDAAGVEGDEAADDERLTRDDEDNILIRVLAVSVSESFAPNLLHVCLSYGQRGRRLRH